MIRRVGQVQQTPKGNLYLECDTDLGVVAVWGRREQSDNIRRMQSLHVPAKVRAGSIVGGWSQHTWWIPEDAAVLPLSQPSAGATAQDSHRTDTGAAAGSRTQGERSRSEGKDSSGKTLDPYAILGIRKGATSAEIRVAYLACMKQYHPDQVTHLGPELRELANRKAQEINRAYEALTGQRK